MDGVQDRRPVRDGTTSGFFGGLARLFFRVGRSLGLVVFTASLVALLYLRFVASHGLSVQSAWPTEGYYFAGAQYQMALQTLRVAVGEAHSATNEQQRAARRLDAAVWRDVLHAKLVILVDSPEIAPYLESVPGFNEAIGPLRKFDAALDGLVADALRDREGLARFEDAVATPYRYVLGMVNDLRVAELSAFEAAFESQHRASLAFLEMGLGLLALIGVGIYFHVHFARKERRAFKHEAEARAEAQRSAQARTALLGMVSHELRTPLQTMLANVELLSTQAQAPGMAAIIERLQNSIDLISGQLDNIAHYTRLASGTMEIRRERFNVVELLRRIVDEHAAAATVNQQTISLQAHNEPDITIHGDPIRLHQVVNNYLTNAIKYAGPGHICVAVRLRTHRFGDLHIADAVEILVEDKGPGIPAAERQSMWEPFVRGRSAANPRKGSGLGLAVVNLLATSVGWEVGVRTEVGHGATFNVIVPLDGPTTASPSLPEPAPIR